MFYEMIKYKAREAEHNNNNNNIEKYNKPNNGMRLDFVNVSTWQIFFKSNTFLLHSTPAEN